MKLYVLFAQREERYPGQYAPEALAVVTEYDRDENPEWIIQQVEQVSTNPDFMAADLFEIDLGQAGGDAIRRHLVDFPRISGTVKPSE